MAASANGKTEVEKKTSWGSGGLFGNRALGSLMLMLVTPIFVLSLWYTCAEHEGSLSSVGNEIMTKGPVYFLQHVWPTPFDPYAWKLIGSYMAFELLLMRLVPGKVFKATPTASGHVPVYNANGVQCYVITILTLFALAKYDVLKLGDIYDNMGKLLSSMNLFAILFCIMLTFKGLYLPSTKDSGSNGNLIIDFFWVQSPEGLQHICLRSYLHLRGYILILLISGLWVVCCMN